MTMENPWENPGKSWKIMENHGTSWKIMEKPMENPWENHGKTMENPWENPWKIHGKITRVFNGNDLIFPWIPGDFHGFQPHLTKLRRVTLQIWLAGGCVNLGDLPPAYGHQK